MNYYHISNMGFFGAAVDEVWLHREAWGKLFCPECGWRLPRVDAVDINIDKRKFFFLIGAFGYPNVGFIERQLRSSLEPEISSALNFGTVFDCEGVPVEGMMTIAGKLKQVPLRGYDLLTSEVCRWCKRLGVTGSPNVNRYVVSKHGLSQPIYESSECQLVLREDMLERIRNLLDRKTLVETLTIEPHGHDGRTEPELEYPPEG